MKFIQYGDQNPVNLDNIVTFSKGKTENWYFINFLSSNKVSVQWNFLMQRERDAVYDQVMIHADVMEVTLE